MCKNPSCVVRVGGSVVQNVIYVDVERGICRVRNSDGEKRNRGGTWRRVQLQLDRLPAVVIAVDPHKGRGLRGVAATHGADS